MSQVKSKESAPGSPAKGVSMPAAAMPPLYRRIDWITFGVTTFLVLLGYLMTLAPDLTLEDSGELAVGSYYCGVPHPPGYPVWTVFTWLFTVLLPVSNIAFRVGVASAVAAATACGLLALMVSRGSSMIIEGMAELKNIDRRWENFICMTSGFVAGCLLAFNGFFWSQAIIVEVYCLGVLSLMGVMCCLLRWVYAPHQYRYLYLAAFLFGVCFTNHQTLLVAAMGIEVAVLAVKPRLGRNLFFINSLVYLLGLFGKYKGWMTTFDQNVPLFTIFNVIGIGSIYIVVWYSLTVDALTRLKILLVHFAGVALIWLLWIMGQQKGTFKDSDHTLLLFLINALGIGLIYFYYWLTDMADRIFTLEDWLPALAIAGAWMVGSGLYFLMPLFSSTNPPMNWGYARTWDGFLHALTRGQYERTNPTGSLGKFLQQLWMFGGSAVEEFNVVYLLIGLVPFACFTRMQKRERSWFTGLFAIFLCLGILLMILLNPGTDRANKDLNKVFFTASFSLIAIVVGYGLALIMSFLVTQYQNFRMPALYGGAVAAGIALYTTVATYRNTTVVVNLDVPQEIASPLMFYTDLFGLALAVGFIVILILSRTKTPTPQLLGLIALMPLHPFLAHWADNEQHGHLFGFWFGHDMFTPPDFGKPGQFYPEMARDAILFGGTDPGRFCPTYMIFCESFIPPQKRRDPKFDRRDVYIITQNALADGTYLNYIRAHYNRSTQKDTPFFQEMFRMRKEAEANDYTNALARAVEPLDQFLNWMGAKVEQSRRAEKVYPPKEIHTPSPEESKKCFEDYISDAQRRLQANQLELGEDVRVIDNRVQVSGQVSVMQINGLLTKVIFDANPNHEFYVEESFPLKWMYPYLTPFGIIMKINRQPVPEMTEEMVKKDHEFWSQYSDRLCGNWIKYDTSLQEICDFVQRVYRRRDYTNFRGDRKFVRDNDAQKAFSKLRSAIAGLYAWRVNAAAPGSAEQQRVLKEAEFAFKQSFAFCPYSPEAVFRYVNLLISAQRVDEALLIAKTCFSFDPENKGVRDLVENLRILKEQGARNFPAQAQPNHLEQQLQQNPANIPMAFNLVNSYLQQQQTNKAMAFLDQMLAQMEPQFRANTSNIQLGFWVAQAYAMRQKADEANTTLDLLITNLNGQYRANSNNANAGLQLAQAYLQRQKLPLALDLVEQVIASPSVDAQALTTAAQQMAAAGNPTMLEKCLVRLVKIAPENPEGWYDLAALQCMMGKQKEALDSLGKSIQFGRIRKAKQPAAKDVAAMASQDSRFQALKQLPEFAKLIKGE
jgi:thioredoxin-like negative regulator of GroEL